MRRGEPKIRGLGELEENIKKLPYTMRKKVVRAGLTEATKVIVKDAKANAPVRTGALRRNIKARAGKKGKARRHGRFAVTRIVGVEHGKVGQLLATSKGFGVKTSKGVRKASAREKRGEDPYYWWFQELGYTTRGGTRVHGKRFLTRAFTSNTWQIMRAMAKGMRKKIERLRL